MFLCLCRRQFPRVKIGNTIILQDLIDRSAICQLFPSFSLSHMSLCITLLIRNLPLSVFPLPFCLFVTSFISPLFSLDPSLYSVFPSFFCCPHFSSLSSSPSPFSSLSHSPPGIMDGRATNNEEENQKFHLGRGEAERNKHRAEMKEANKRNNGARWRSEVQRISTFCFINKYILLGSDLFSV